MSGFLFKRAIHSIFSLAGLLVLVFFLARLTGDATNVYLPLDATLEARQAFAEKHGFNDPIYVQFGRFVVDLAQGDMGQSLMKARPAIDVVIEAFWVTLSLAAVVIPVAFLGSVIIGSLAAYRPGGAFDRIATIFALLGASAPDFWIAITAIIIFALSLAWLPTSGYEGHIAYWVMPCCVLLIRPFGLLVQVARGSMMSVFTSAFVKTARAKGVKESSVIFVHALRNAMLPIITVAGDQAAGILNGAVIVETIFGWPGVGKLMIDSIFNRDFAVLQASILVTAIAIFSVNIVIDLVYALLDPRIRHN